MNNGIVDWFNPAKGFGMIKNSMGELIFVHYSNIQMDGFKNLEVGDKVSFDCYVVYKNGEELFEARNVRKV